MKTRLITTINDCAIHVSSVGHELLHAYVGLLLLTIFFLIPIINPQASIFASYRLFAVSAQVIRSRVYVIVTICVVALSSESSC